MPTNSNVNVDKLKLHFYQGREAFQQRTRLVLRWKS